MNDILEVLYLFSKRIGLGTIDKDMSVSETEVKMIDQHSKNIDMQDMGLFWQLTIKTIDDLRIVGNENLTLEMYIMQLVHLKNIVTRRDISNNIENNDAITNENKVFSSLAASLLNSLYFKRTPFGLRAASIVASASSFAIFRYLSALDLSKFIVSFLCSSNLII